MASPPPRLTALTSLCPIVPTLVQGFFIADQLCSQSLALGDLGVTVHSLSAAWLGFAAITTRRELDIRMICSLVPYWCRFWQCVRRAHDEQRRDHLVNAGKYFTSMLGVIAARTTVAIALHEVRANLGLGMTYYMSL